MKGTRGQVLPITMGLVLLAAVAIFMVVNSHRAVDEKMNLVNAADAAAFSGAQMAARELNFMALTNRAMVANEVAIGHMMAYQTELDVIADALTTGVGGLIGGIISGILDLLGGDAIINNFNQINRIWSGAYILAANASNALYQDYQEDDYRALAGIERDSLLDAVMTTIAQQYQIAPDVSISVNSEEAIAHLRSLDRPELDDLATAAQTNPFCNVIAFAAPSASGGDTPFDDTDRFDSLGAECASYYQSGTVPSALGALSQPVSDGGMMLDLLNRSAASASSSDWVLQRNIDYRIAGVRVERRGESSAQWDSAANQINWQTNGNDTLRTRGLLSLLISFSGEADGDARELAAEASNNIGGAVTDLLRLAGMCDEIDCDSLANSTYTGVQRYALLNPQMVGAAPVVTAVLYQDGNCNDDLGWKNGSAERDMVTDMPMFGDVPACSAQKPVVAYARAQVLYQRPPCSDATCSNGFDTAGVSDEQPNLFNPFWQARLVPSQ